MKLNEQLARTAVIFITEIVSHHLKKPNSEKSRQAAQRQSELTGIHHLEIHRFYNAIVNSNLSKSFTEERAGEIAFALIKAEFVIWGKLPDKKMIEIFRKIAAEQQVSVDLIMTLVRTAFTEIIEDRLQPGKSL